MPRVVVDAGHGGKSRANRGKTGYIEADGVLDISLKVRDLLKKYPSIEVCMTREKDETWDTNPRVARVNSFKADLVVSIHSNADNGQGTARGTVAMYSMHSEKGKRFAHALVDNICKEAGTIKRSPYTKALPRDPKKDYYFMIREIKTTSVIVECAFHTNLEDEALLKTESFRMKCAIGIAKSIVEYFGLKWIDNVEEPKKEVSKSNTMYRVSLNGRQIGAFSVKANAMRLADSTVLVEGDVLVIKEGDKEMQRREVKSVSVYGIVYDCSTLNIRSGRGTQYKILGTLKRGERVKLDKLVNGWWSMSHNGKVGFVSARYIKKL